MATVRLLLVGGWHGSSWSLTYDKIAATAKERGWTVAPWYSSHGSDFKGRASGIAPVRGGDPTFTS